MNDELFDLRDLADAVAITIEADEEDMPIILAALAEAGIADLRSLANPEAPPYVVYVDRPRLDDANRVIDALGYPSDKGDARFQPPPWWARDVLGTPINAHSLDDCWDAFRALHGAEEPRWSRVQLGRWLFDDHLTFDQVTEEALLRAFEESVLDPERL